VLLNWRSSGILLFLGVLLTLAIITGVVLNTIFLVREIRRNEQHDSFINAVTHELKTPVASIRLYLETLQRREINETKRREFYGIMLDDCDRLLGTIEQVLRTGRVGPSSRRLTAVRVDLHEMVQECLALARSRRQLPPGALEYAETLRNGEHPIVMGDLNELKAAVLNLVDNAIKYSGPAARVLVELVSLDNGRAAIRVRDQGVGIPRTELKRIFRRFYRIPEAVASRVAGTGLGLFIVRSVAKRHGGRAFAESEGPNRGSTFTIQLPVASGS
jgi:signal transduction histidine kinase